MSVSEIARGMERQCATIHRGLMETGAVGGYRPDNAKRGARATRLDEGLVLRQPPGDAPTYAINIQKLLARRNDGFIVDDIGVMGSEAAALGVLDQVERYPLAIASKDLDFMFSRASVDPVLIAAIDRSLAATKADGRLQAIADRFLKRAP